MAVLGFGWWGNSSRECPSHRALQPPCQNTYDFAGFACPGMLATDVAGGGPSAGPRPSLPTSGAKIRAPHHKNPEK